MNMPIFSQKYNEKCLDIQRFKVFYVIGANHALAFECNDGDLCFTNPVVLLTPLRGVDFYDDMMFNIPSSKCAVQDGVYKYETQKKVIKTVPRITYEYKYATNSEEELEKRIDEKIEDIRYECKLFLTETPKYNTEENRKKCDCSIDYLITNLSYEKIDLFNQEVKKSMEKKCGKLPNGFWN